MVSSKVHSYVNFSVTCSDILCKITSKLMKNEKYSDVLDWFSDTALNGSNDEFLSWVSKLLF